jgi:hypothetical protein
MKRYLQFAFPVVLRSLVLIITSFVLVACTQSQPNPKPTPQLKVVTLNAVKAVEGQTVYVPIYSHIYTVNQNQTIDLAATLSVRNTDLTNRIIIASIRYYNTNGELVRQYLEQPVELRPLASAEFVVNQEDTSGGVGANFVVEWLAEKQVSNPVIEAVMMNTMGNQGISFVSPGRAIESRGTQSKS